MDCVDDIYPYEYTATNGLRSQCRVRIYTAQGEQPVVIITEPGPIRNQGNAVTNSIEIIVAQVWRRYFPDMDMLPTIIEHSPRSIKSDPRGQEQFTLVTFEKISKRMPENPKWDKVSREEIERRIGHELPPASTLWAAYSDIAERVSEVGHDLDSLSQENDRDQYNRLVGQQEALAWVVRLLEIDPARIMRRY